MRTQDTFLHTSNCVAHVKTAVIFIPARMEITAVLYFLRKVNISSLSDTPDRKKSDTLTAKILHPFRIDGAWRPHGLRTAATPLDHSEIAFSRLMDSPLMVST